jgi:hypothetical protein
MPRHVPRAMRLPGPLKRLAGRPLYATVGPVPAYKNRPPMSGDTPVWRYLTLSAVIATIKTQHLRLTRVDRFQDPFEGSVPKKQIEDEIPLFIAAASGRTMMNCIAAHYPDMASLMPPDEDLSIRTTRLRRARTRSAHASCWSAGDESEALWRLYCADDGCRGVGVALRTTLARLDASVAAHDFYVSPITYLKYYEAPAFTDEMDSLLHKRHGFAAEHELRLLKFNEAHFRSQVSKEALVSELSEHIYVDWVLSDVIDKLIISPYADVNYEDLVRDAINAKDPNLADRVVLSVLHERQYPPCF